MFRILIFLAAILALAVGLAWFADRPGMVTVEWLGYQVETSLFVGAVALVAAAALLILLWSVLRYVLTRPAAISAYMKERRRKQGFDALSKGLLAIGVGDKLLAQRCASTARRHLPNEPLTALLRAQAAQLKGDRAAARRMFESMLQSPDTELLGLRGLFLEAKRQNDSDAALHFVERAVRHDPLLGWSVNALFELETSAADWGGALKTLETARRYGHVDAKTAQRRRAVLLTAQAMELEEPQPDKALPLALEAHRLAPDLIPAAEIAGRLLASRGESSRASRLLTKTWKLAPHPDLATVYAFARAGEPPRDRLRRIKQLAATTPGDIEGAIAVAVAAIEAREWQMAREALQPFLEDRPPARVCALMARIESGEFADTGREREWLAKAFRASRDRAWVADGYVSDRWLPVSPATGAFDAFQWKAPVESIGVREEVLMSGEEAEPAEPVPAPVAKLASEPPMVEASPAELPEPQPEEDRPLVALVNEAPEDVGRQHEKSETEGEDAKPTKPQIFVPPRPPDDPGIDADADAMSPLERLRAAQIR